MSKATALVRTPALALFAALTGLATMALFAALLPSPLFAQPSLLEQGRLALGRGDLDAAIEILQRAVVESPQSAEAHYYLASAYAGKMPDGGMLGKIKYGPKIKAELETSVALDPKHVDARTMLVMVYSFTPRMMGGSDEKALEQAKAIKAIDSIAGHHAYALIYTEQKKSDLAKREYLDAVREQPDSPKSHCHLGRYLANVDQDYAAAFTEFETALKLDPAYMPSYYYLGRAAALGKTNLARGEEALKRYLAYTPTEKEPALANAHYFLGAVYESAEKKAEAKRSYESALGLNPTLKDASKALKRVS